MRPNWGIVVYLLCCQTTQFKMVDWLNQHIKDTPNKWLIYCQLQYIHQLRIYNVFNNYDFCQDDIVWNNRVKYAGMVQIGKIITRL